MSSDTVFEAWVGTQLGGTVEYRRGRPAPSAASAAQAQTLPNDGSAELSVTSHRSGWNPSPHHPELTARRLTGHPAPSPLEMLYRCIAAGSPPGGRVLDPFCGASTTGLVDRQVTLCPGDAAEVIAGMPAASVDCVVTSPPYWGLRDYRVAGQYAPSPLSSST